ncbi:MAG: GNAT family N-acetyltransferase [Arcanobacterium sp.]|nr:GNAT family N-acetyltransferase [Arcanobacterium sp.]
MLQLLRSRSRARLRPLRSSERAMALGLCERNPVETVMIHARLQASQVAREPNIIAAFDREGQLVGLCLNEANIIPWNIPEDLRLKLAKILQKRKGRVNSLVGPARDVLPIWELLKKSGWKAFDERPKQLLMQYFESPQQEQTLVRVRQAQAKDFPEVFPAAVEMFFAELGYDPTASGDAYYQHVHQLIRNRRTFIREQNLLTGKKLVFKADIGTQSTTVAQIQGVWTHPDFRGQGIATASMREIARYIRKDSGREVSLYVNDYNFGAIQAYLRAGFRTVGEFSTILL